jgi:alginate O-acetyltransferase complex protein AlgI
MLFNSLTFILIFLPVALLVYYGFASWNPRWARLWLVAVSVLFYTWWTASLVFLLCGSVVFNFLSGFLILRARGRDSLQGLLLGLAISGNLLLLFYYKYFFGLLNWFGLHGLIQLSHPYSMILPLGISFFTFTQIGYLVDCKGGVVTSNRPLDYGLFVTFFPHLIAGPILHHREMMPQFADPKTYRFQWRNLAVGMTLFVMGLAKKVVIADQLSSAAGDAFGRPGGLAFFPAWDGALSYSLQLYFDFSGYSDMAIGLALLFGLRFPANFDSPYRAASIIDFWQRWHMTLTRYLTLYLYTPMALWVSRWRVARGKSVSRQAISTPGGFLSLIAFPTLFTMILAGVWHGAGMQFLIFGLLHGIYIIINHAWRSFGPRVSKDPPHPVLRVAADLGKIALTYFAVVVAQVFFRAASVGDALRLLHGMAGGYGLFGHAAGAENSSSAAPGSLLGFLHGTGFRGSDIFHAAFVCGLFVVVWIMPNSLQMLDRYEPTLSRLASTSLIKLEWRPNVAWGIVFGLVATLALLEITGMSEFLYFRF